MAKTAGRLHTFLIGGSDTAVNGLTDASISVSNDLIDTTTNDDGATKSYISGRIGGTVSLSGLYDFTDAGLLLLETDAFSGTSSACKFRMTTAGSDRQYTGTCLVDSFDVSTGGDGATEFSASLQFTGTVTKATQ